MLGHQLTKTKWFTGPEFLMKNKTEWPGLDEDIRDIDDDDPEVKREQVVASIFQSCEHPTIIDLVEKQSSWFKTCKLVTWLTKFSN